MTGRNNTTRTDAKSWHRRQLFFDKAGAYGVIACSVLMTILLFSIIFFVGRQGLLTFQAVSPLDFFFSAKWEPTAGAFGAASFLAGSLLTTLVAILLGAPLGLAGAIYLAQVAPPAIRKILRPAVDLYVAIPSVVYGYMGLTLLLPFLRDNLGLPSGFGIFSAGVVLAIMIFPTVLTLAADAIHAVPSPLEEGSIALGATWWQTLRHITLPAAAPGITTGIILAMARAVGETMAVEMLIGNTPQLATSLFQPTATLTSNIVVEMGNTPFGSAWGNSLFLMAFVLLILSLFLILLVRHFSARKEAA